MKKIVVPVSMFLFLAISIFAQQRPGVGGPPDPLRGLRKALEEASAPALSTTQEEQLKALIEARRATQPEPDTQLQAAHQAYNTAILAGDQATANAQAAVIANLQTSLTSVRLQAEAKFKLDVLAILKTNGDQAGLLRQKLGDEGLLRVLSSLGGRGFGGPGGPGFGPGGGGRRGSAEK